MSKNLDIKKQKVEEVFNKITEANQESKSKGLNTVVFEYSKLTSNEFNELRSKIFNDNASLKVLKNTLIKILFKKFDVNLENNLEGQNAVLVSDKNFTAPIKTLAEYIKSSTKGVFKLGILDGKIISGDEVLKLSKIPSREVLLGQMLAGFNSPIRGFVSTLNETNAKFVRVLGAIKDSK